MKTLRRNGMLLLCFLTGCYFTASSQDQSSVPGDDFSLEGALELFKKSSSPEEFEKMLNSEDGKVNNLDLNGDNNIDYIRVIDRNEGNVHAFILQAVISENESQDVAVIELEKLANGKAVLQITGDADIYGIETIIEPTEEVRVNAGASTARTVVNVWAWPSVQYVYSPYYNVWVSPWAWSIRPVWWSPWRPISYFVYDPWWQPYRPYYSVCYTHRIGYAHQLYRPYRTTSVIVYNRHHTQIANYRSTRNDQSSYGGRGRSDNRNNSSYQHSRSDNQHYNGSRNGRNGNEGSTQNRWRDQGQQNNGNGRTNGRSSSSTSRNWSADNGRSSTNFRGSDYSQRNSQQRFNSDNRTNGRSSFGNSSLPGNNNQRITLPSNNQRSSQAPSFQRGSGNHFQPSGSGGGGNRSGGGNNGGSRTGSGGGQRGRH